MKLKITVMILVITFSIHTKGFALELDQRAMHTGEERESVIINELIDAFLFNAGDIVLLKKEPEVYTVNKGDNLFRIALNHQVALSDLMDWNDKKAYTIQPGEELIIKEGNKTTPKISKLIAATTPILPSSLEVQEKPVTESPAQPTISLEAGEAPEAGQELTVTATAYTAYCKGCSGTTAIGIDLRENPNQKVIAVDPTIIPLGSKIWVEGYGEAIAGDTGGAIKGNKIDVFIPSREQALQWGRKKVKIKILN